MKINFTRQKRHIPEKDNKDNKDKQEWDNNPSF